MSILKLLSSVACCMFVLTACGDDLTAQAKKAAAEISAEAKKTASQKIEEAKNGTIDQLKQIRVEPSAEKDKKPADSDAKSSSEKGK
jgi:hypothetical protein